MVTIFSTCRQGCVVDKVEVAGHFLETISCDAGCNGRVVEFLVPGPVISDLWFPSNAHQYPESQVCPDFLHVCLPSRLTPMQHLTGIPVGLPHYQVQHLRIKKDGEHFKWVRGHGDSGSYWFLASLYIHY